MRKALAAVVAGGLALPVASCGDDDGAGGPASLVPADAAGYFELSVRPEGEAREDAEAALGTLLDTEQPGEEIIALLEREAAQEGEGFDWERDIEPWLGERAAAFPSDLAGESEATLVVETTDPELALDYVREQEGTEDGEREREYEGRSFQLGDDGDAFGLLDDSLVFGDVRGFRQAVDASEGDALADSDDYQEALDSLPDDRLSTLYLPLETFLETIPAEEIDPTGRAVLLQALGEAGEQPLLGSLTASEDSLAFELSAAGEGGETEQSPLLGELPADSWAAFGFADVGGAVRSALEGLESAGFPVATLSFQLRQESGIDVERDLSTLGDAALFVSGTTERKLGGALIVESEDQDAAASLLSRVESLIRREGEGIRVQPLAAAEGDAAFELIDRTGELPQPVRVLQRDERIVVGYGSRALTQALEPGRTLAGSDAFGRAAQAVGELGLDAFIAPSPALELARSLGGDADADLESVREALQGVDYLAVGSGARDDRSLVRLVLGLR
jgi:hypothetical protein